MSTQLREYAQRLTLAVFAKSFDEICAKFGVGEQAELRQKIASELVIEQPKDKSLAHFATPVAFGLAKVFRRAPNLIAQELAAALNSNLNESFGEAFEVSALNGYVNLRFTPNLLQKFANEALEAGEKFGANLFCQEGSVRGGEGERSNSNSTKQPHSLFVEYISANPTGPLHIGHVRGAVFGDCLVRLGRHLGANVRAEYYINDAGNQIALLGESISLYARENLLNQSVTYPEKFYRGDYIKPIAQEALERFGEEIFTDAARNDELAEFGKDKVLEIIKKDLAGAKIEIESWASERSFYPQLEATLTRLKQSGEVYEKEGATYIQSTKLGDDQDRIVVRSDGRATYLAGDIVYHAAKFDTGFDRYINIWGADHHGYIPRLKAALHFLGYDESKLEVVLMQMVSLLKDGEAFKMSKRAGNAILMSDVLSEIGADALRFIFISKLHTTPLEFDVETLKKQDASNPVFYINYAFARVNQLFAKAQKTPSCVLDADLTTLSPEAQNLLFEALSLPDVMLNAFVKREIHKLPEFLRQLASDLHKFYNENRVLNSKDEAAFLKLFAVVANTIFVGLTTLGITPKRVMN